MPNLTEEQIQLYQAFSRLMPGDQFVSSSGTVAVIEAIQSMIDASLLKDKAQSVNNAEPLLKDNDDNLLLWLRDVAGEIIGMGRCEEAADKIEQLKAGFQVADEKWSKISARCELLEAALRHCVNAIAEVEKCKPELLTYEMAFRLQPFLLGAMDNARYVLGEKKDGS